MLGRQVLVLLLSFCQFLCAAPVVVGATKTTISAVVLISFCCSSVAPVVVGVMPASTSAVAFFCSFFKCCTDGI